MTAEIQRLLYRFRNVLLVMSVATTSQVPYLPGEQPVGSEPQGPRSSGAGAQSPAETLATLCHLHSPLSASQLFGRSTDGNKGNSQVNCDLTIMYSLAAHSVTI